MVITLIVIWTIVLKIITEDNTKKIQELRDDLESFKAFVTSALDEKGEQTYEKL